ncbi:hypothetical protein BC941DRAFT_458049 [Chlamydoabsidia padenii]|nr:hypothetical protein BC941DRAFT_458049 [Chlamydoabsidia padenii]
MAFAFNERQVDINDEDQHQPQQPLQLPRTRLRRPRLDIQRFTDSESKEFFRLTHNDIRRICVAMDLPETIDVGTPGRPFKMTREFGLAVFLRRLAFPSRLVDIRHFFN